MCARITLFPAHRTIEVGAEEIILDAALRAGLNLPYSCRGGICSSCRARIVSGEVNYPTGRPPGLMAQEERAGYVLLCQAHPASDEVSIQVREIAPVADIQLRSLPCRIEQLRALTPHIMAVTLRLPAAEQFSFVAGQHLQIMFPGGNHRSYWIANPPHDAQSLELHVQRVPQGGFSDRVFSAGGLKGLLRIGGPLGEFRLREDSPRPVILFGEGIGYAPLRSMLRHLLERGDRRALHLYWAAQAQEDLYDDATLRDWCSRHDTLRYTPVLSAGAVQFVLKDHSNLCDFDVYAAGSAATIEALQSNLLDRGLPASQLFCEASTAATNTGTRS